MCFKTQPKFQVQHNLVKTMNLGTGLDTLKLQFEQSLKSSLDRLWHLEKAYTVLDTSTMLRNDVRVTRAKFYVNNFTSAEFYVTREGQIF